MSGHDILACIIFFVLSSCLLNTYATKDSHHKDHVDSSTANSHTHVKITRLHRRMWWRKEEDYKKQRKILIRT